ncbi:serine/threonine protein kinase [Hazenella coriacea]|uniref:Serine/threonine protein kinase n=1 Tax=Hazenella coriacea TaxID=1179467 RepID=A0A4R3L617_9BACL|nr:serine/threonine protein kinase [Hazenella coriacea]TCS95089.1 hypothetical protein EDD58_103515 [Hazenella coriacea]
MDLVKDQHIDHLLKQIQIHVNKDNQIVIVNEIPSEFHLIGLGTDAIVVWHPSEPKVVFKVFAPDRQNKKVVEATVYEQLGSHPNFCRYFGQGEHYLILSYEQGPTLYQCLEEGIEIPEQVVQDVEEARKFARMKGLNPRDIHLKNVIYQDGHAKVVDVSEYLKEGNDLRWDHLVEGYRHYYPLIRGRKIPTWMIEFAKKRYMARASEEFSIKDFFLSLNNYITEKLYNQEKETRSKR